MHLGGLVDEQVLALAGEQERIVITHNVRHFVPVARSWAAAGRSHPGLILVTLRHTDYVAILRRLEHAFAALAEQAKWVERVESLGHTRPPGRAGSQH